MGNVLQILKRDVLRLLKVPPAMVVIVALLVLPSLYTWYNVIGFWNPYENTKELSVAVVNKDRGGSSEITGELNIGDMIVQELEQNDQLHWEFDEQEDVALGKLYSEGVYAVFVIPEDFTKDLLTLTTGNFVKPDIAYYVNEKAGPVAPKITDSGATTLDETINSAFIKTVSRKVVDALDEGIGEARMDDAERQSVALNYLASAIEGIDGVAFSMDELQNATDSMGTKIDAAKSSLDSAQSAIDEAAGSLDEIASLSATLGSDLARLSAQAMPAVNKSILLIAQTSAKAAQTASDLAQSAAQAQGNIASAIASANAIIAGNETAIASLGRIANSVPDGTTGKAELLQAVQLLESANERAKANVGVLEAANENAGKVADDALKDMNDINDAVQQATVDAQNYSNELFGTVIPALEDLLASLSAAASAASTSVNSQRLMIDQARSLMGDMGETNDLSKRALEDTIGLLASAKDEIATIKDDVVSVSESQIIASIFGDEVADGLDAQSVSDFIGSPTSLVTKQLYPLNAYGAAMAPLFMNLTFWIGAFMLIVIMRQEVDAEGIKRLTLTQRYLGRFLLFAIMVILQASICCIGLPIIGVEIQSLPALFLAAIIASLAYLSIIYALSVTLQHVGKGICIVLVFAQIPGATGLYPIEMTAPFFQAVYPLLPFTYGINAMREAICGFYEMHYLTDILVLVLFFAAFMAFGILMRPVLSNVNRLVAHQIKQSGIYNGENAEVPARRYRLSQVIRALADKEEYKRAIDARFERFERIYPKLIRWLIAIAVVVPLVFTIVFTLNNNEKIILLNAWLIWLLAIFLALIIIESIKASISRQMQLEDMSESELRSMYLERNHMEYAGGNSADLRGGKPADGTAQDGEAEDAQHPSTLQK